MPLDFARHMVAWQRQQGRQHLPWQHTRDPYRVWLSEIMLQQTQVSTVLDYYPRFLARCPDVAALADAPEDVVLGLWSGLGYYSRARNLHRCAQEVVACHGGQFPTTALELQGLPGIGRSTAAAIAAFCFHERAAILDGNVQRVLSRVLGYGEDLAVLANVRRLWALAEQLLPEQAADMPAYTQALMDLGATVCLPRRTRCEACPVAGDCAGRQRGDPLRYPLKSRKLKRSSASLWLLWLVNPQGQVWLLKRPAGGIWSGLFSLPTYGSESELLAACPQAQSGECVAPWKHVLTHRDLYLHPVRVPLGDRTPRLAGQWVNAADWPALGLPAPIRSLLAGERA